MGKIDVIQAVFDSFELIRLHYKEVAVPLIILALIAAAGHSGGSSFSNGFNNGRNSGSSSLFSNSMIANAIDSAAPGTAYVFPALTITLAIVLAIVIVLAFVLAIFSQAVWFYVYEHFYALLLKKKVSHDWKTRMKRHSLKASFFVIFWAIVIVILLALPAFQLWNSISSLSSQSNAAFVDALLSVLLVLSIALLALLLLGFLLSPLWVFYAMDGLGFFESVSRSFSLVAGNLTTFIVLGFLFFLLGIGGALAGMAACCFSFIVSPLLSVFVGLLWGVTLMKVKLALGKK